MGKLTLTSLEKTLAALIDANPHSRNKGDKFKAWCREHFNCDARISYVKEQRQITNRVSEQFRYYAPIVVFVCVPDVKRDKLMEYILQRDYAELENVAIIGVTDPDGKRVYSYEHLITFQPSAFSAWASRLFTQVEDADSLKRQMGIPVSTAGAGGSQQADGAADIDEASRIPNGFNALLYGVPGCGKSWTVEHEYCGPGTVAERVVFHPDYTNADFVGQILPVVDPADKQVTYAFTPGPFTNILREAYRHPYQKYALVIEEVSRGNAPAIFGDIFQLLDRMVEEKTVDGVTYPAGTSEYGVTNGNVADIVYGSAAHKVRIPSNLSIFGTMNTSDQNTSTLDTAFQRRWRMRLVENSFRHVRVSLADALILDTQVTWRRFCETINGIIVGSSGKLVSAEDKRLGVYFVHESDLKFDGNARPDGGYPTLAAEMDALMEKEQREAITDAEQNRLRQIREALIQIRVFPEKVIKYLWDDGFKLNLEALFDTERMESLEQVIRTFVYSEGQRRFDIFKPTVRQLLYPGNP